MSVSGAEKMKVRSNTCGVQPSLQVLHRSAVAVLVGFADKQLYGWHAAKRLNVHLTWLLDAGQQGERCDSARQTPRQLKHRRAAITVSNQMQPALHSTR